MPRFRDQESDAYTTGDSEQRPCSQDQWCRGYRIEDGKRLPALTPRVFCEPCTEHITRSLGEIPDLFARLHAELGNKGQGGERVSGSREAPVPVRLDIDALKREIIDVLASWDERIRSVLSLDFPGTEAARRRRDGVAVALYVQTLELRMTTLLGLERDAVRRDVPLDGVQPGDTGFVHLSAGYATVNRDLSGKDAGLDILRLHRRASGVLGHYRQVDELDVPCPKCDCVTLVRVAGDDRLRCTSCGHTPEDREYRNWTRLLAGGAWYYRHMAVRLEPLLALPPGWDGRQGKPVTHAAAGGMHSAITALMRPEYAPPLYDPLPDGGIVAYWGLTGDEVTVTITPDGSAWALATLADGTVTADGDLGPGMDSVPAVRDLLAVLSKRIYDAMGVRAVPRVPA